MVNIYNKTKLELQNLLEQYPYCSLLHWQMAQRQKSDIATCQEEPKHKMWLHFPHQIWASYLLEKRIPQEDVCVSAEDSAQKLEKILAVQAASFSQAVEEEMPLYEEPEPLFKTDYFKHQGIETLPHGHSILEKRVRKFTDWLKEMKKLNEVVPQFTTTAKEELAVATSAQNSLENREVITESMAEVLLLQGKERQAIKLYEKLSLSNPEKSTYFADKIKRLKEK